MINASRIVFFIAVVLSAGCVSQASRGWPKPDLAYTHAATAAQAKARVSAWVGSAPGRNVRRATGTGSMRPHIRGGDREFHLCEQYTGQVLSAGRVVIFDRGDSPECEHMIAVVRRGGESVFITGTNNAHSDGWFNRSKIKELVLEVVTLPALPVLR